MGGHNITTCSCEKPIYVGIIDTGLPQVCNQKSPDDMIKMIEYDEITRHDIPVNASGYLCKTFDKNKTTTMFFFGSWNIDVAEAQRETSVEECITMIQQKNCSGNKMTNHGDYWSHIAEPESVFKWLSAQTSTVRNCEIESFTVTQDHPGAPIKSKYGILAEGRIKNKS